MNHLSDREFVDLVENVLTPARVAHVLDCAECRTEADALRRLLAHTSEAHVPEPSPLFWEHFSSRVRDGIEHAEIGNTSAWSTWTQQIGWKWAVPVAMVATMAVAAFGLWRWSPRVHAPAPMRAELPAGPANIDAVSDIGDADNDEAWAIVRTIADESSWDDVSDASVHQGSAERALAMLTPEERQELVRLLEAATKRPGA
jgi:hypothetical protein